jgi:peptidoglycan hydrolase CwlO-like protein
MNKTATGILIGILSVGVILLAVLFFVNSSNLSKSRQDLDATNTQLAQLQQKYDSIQSQLSQVQNNANNYQNQLTQSQTLLSIVPTYN